MLNACFVIHTPRWPASTSTSRMAGHSHKNAHYNRAKFLLLHTFQWTTWAAGSSGLAKRRSETYLCCTIYTYLAAICAEILRLLYTYKLTAGQTGFVWQNDVQCRNGGRPITSLFILLLADCCTLNIWLTGQIFYCPPICLQLSVIRPKMVEPHCGRQST